MPTWIGAGGAIGAAWFAHQTMTSRRQQIGEQQEFTFEQEKRCPPTGPRDGRQCARHHVAC
ncbi:hypothetical protein A4E84_12285 [Streptomyces qaidamensis]|uniref:Uncharacterized protein n=1 Tax=Streptomyces qaidamensis TaxID=1783515 RepID=A0A143BZ53_9ACTN|nr:hypothetical protein A4E84_12285 [Streptomyces qaidamensis]